MRGERGNGSNVRELKVAKKQLCNVKKSIGIFIPCLRIFQV